ncbi:NfeD family protein [Galbitalea sp. SE-J8]|uniref:NfeD family protein n=1 Tax=Galbitalea sp. SE-J8 TaxID=3054952 RepID=UPI00259C6ED1|nr:NfeD family protein [Galbitalea sp. SE-J8]MDM4764006.1 NfeD family protein [Galbitalea sp. SE-J8]
MDPVLLDYLWIVWIALILIFGVVEIFTLDFTFLMLAVGSVGGLLTSLFGGPAWLQVIVAAVLTLALLFFVRPPLLRALRSGGDPTPSNVDALLGLVGSTSTAFVDGAGQVKLTNGETWTARLVPAASDSALVIGDRVRVVAIEGATAIVEPIEGSLP